MEPKISAQLYQLDAALDLLIAKLLKERPEKLAHKPSPERWSVYEVMQHLMAVERASMRYLQKKLQDPKALPSAGWGSGIRAALLRSRLRSSLKLKAPAAASTEVFEEVASFAQLTGEWQAQRAELRDLLEKQPEVVFQKAAYKHPSAGRMTIENMLKFFLVHFQRHLKQINENLKV
jgi:hypothetical protein